MTTNELIAAAKRRKECGPDHGLYDMTILADFATRLLLSLDGEGVEAVEREKFLLLFGKELMTESE